jgi:hypothetical protein
VQSSKEVSAAVKSNKHEKKSHNVKVVKTKAIPRNAK